MKFVMGLLTGTLGVLAITTVANLDWEAPSRSLPASSGVQETPDSGLLTALEPLTEAESAGSSARVAPSPEPAQSVTVDPEPFVSQAEELTPSPESAAPIETAIVWKPFHSEVSAAGFARRLSVQLGYPFRALREGPAKYHVVFDYGSDEQRELLREQVQALTGFTLL